MKWEEKVRELKNSDPEAYAILNRIYKYYSDRGTMKIPSSFNERALSYMGVTAPSKNNASLKMFKEQQIIKFFNVWTGEGTIFNSLRASRPGLKLEGDAKHLQKLIKDSKKRCDFCDPERYTPEDSFGRIKGKFCITAANIAKYDAWSSLLIFKKHNPLEFSLQELSDYFETAFKWFNKVYQKDERYHFPFMVWNCLYKAGASQIHGHGQLLMTREFPYAKMENLNSSVAKYKKEVGKDYFSDLYYLHHALGLAQSYGEVKFMVSITPLKEKEILIISPEAPSESNEAKEVIFKILRCYVDVLGVESFNLALYCPSLKSYGYPYLVKIVDRGPLFINTADMGGMELYGSSIAANDPYKVIKSIREYWI
ncbi:MAG: hypothetical protein ABFC12_05525 [Methanobacterium sp.]